MSAKKNNINENNDSNNIKEKNNNRIIAMKMLQLTPKEPITSDNKLNQTAVKSTQEPPRATNEPEKNLIYHYHLNQVTVAP